MNQYTHLNLTELFLKIYFIYLNDRVTEPERFKEREERSSMQLFVSQRTTTLHPLRARTKAGGIIVTQLSHFRPSSTTFPGTLTQSWVGIGTVWKAKL